jgi:carbamoyl-phosphate synthase large subunit
MDVDAISDGHDVVIGGIMEQIELAGVHSGDSACVIPTFMVAQEHIEKIREYTVRLAKALRVVGLMNVQYAMRDGVVYVLEVNPRASRTVPFVSKATGIPLAKIAAKVMSGSTLQELGFTREPRVHGYFVKEVALPFSKFPGVDAILGPEMKSTGEGMGVADNFGQAYAKAQMACGGELPLSGTAFLSVNDNDKPQLVGIARELSGIGFRLVATRGTAEFLLREGLQVEPIHKVHEGRPNVVDHIKNAQVDLIVNTPLGQPSFYDEPALRRTAVAYGVPMMTTLSAAWAAVQAIRAMQGNHWTVRPLQEWHRLNRGTYQVK